MPVKRRTIGAPPAGVPGELVAELASELGREREFGQPIIEVDTYPRTNVVLVTVTWDKFESLAEAQRSAVIQEAYARALGPPPKDQTVFAVGYTLQEADSAGRLPYSLVPYLYGPANVSKDEVRNLMLEFGASETPRGGAPAILRFATMDDAVACRAKLIERLPGSDAVWQLLQPVGRPE
jgi:hypothetical protein